MTDLLHFEDFRAGQIFGLGTHTLTPEEMIDYARDFDPQPQHLDPETAKGLLGASQPAAGIFAHSRCA